MDLQSILNVSSPDYLDDEIKEEMLSEEISDPISAVFIRSSSCDLPLEISNENLMICRTCLSNTNIILSEPLSTAYTQATSVFLSDERFPRTLCHRCITYVKKFERFRKASQKTDRILRDLIDREMLNKNSIQKIQKECKYIFPNLSVIHLSPNEYTFSIIEDENGVFKSENINCGNEIYRNENDIDIKSDNDTRSDNDIDLKIDLSETVTPKTYKKEKKETKKKNKIKKKRLTKNNSKNDKNIASFNTKAIKELKIDNYSVIEYEEKPFSEPESDEDKPLILLNEKNRKNQEQKTKKRFKNTEQLTIDKKSKKKQDRTFDEYFSIEILSLEQQKEEFAKRKLSENYISSKLKCDFCFKGFLHERTFNMHMAKHTKRMGDYTCLVCNKHCSSHRSLRHHVDGFHKYKYTCKQCDYQTKTRCTARLHIDYHNGKKYKCEKCDQEFCRQSSLMSHRRVKHATDAVCVLCGYSYLGEKGLQFHRNFKHKFDDLSVLPDGPVCTECDITFASEDALATHRKISPRHGICRRNEPPAVPPRRNKNKQDRPRLINRKNKDIAPSELISNERDSQRVNCEQCGLLVNSAKEYCLHFNKAHSSCTRTLFPQGADTRLCAVCGKHFQNASMLSIHMSSVHSKAPPRHKCGQCGKAFTHRGNLTIHMNIHLGRRFPCPICGKMFNQAFNRDRHYTYVHTLIKDVKCDYCDKCFKSENEKKLHTNYVHFKKPYQKRCRGRKHPDCPPPNKKRREDFSDVPEIGWSRQCDEVTNKEY